MSEQDRSDGPLIGILVVLVLLVVGGLGVLGLGTFRMSRVAMQERDIAEAARQEAVFQRDAAEAARAEAEAIRARALDSEKASAGQTDTVETQPKPDEAESKEN